MSGQSRPFIRRYACLMLVMTVAIFAGSTVTAEPLQYETIIVGDGGELYGFSEVIHSLSVSGFSITLIENTFLNRVRIRSQKDDLIRETIISKSTGLILRDRTWSK